MKALSQQQLIDFLKKQPVFSTCSKGELGKIVRYFHHKEFSKDSVIFNEGDLDKALYLVQEGQVKIYDHYLGTQTPLGEGDFFGEAVLVADNEKRLAKAIAACDTSMYILTKTAFEDIIKRQPHAACQILFQLTRMIGLRQTSLNALL